MGSENKTQLKIISSAIEKGIKYLLSMNHGGHWKGFPTLAGESDIWVTGFILTHIHHLTKQVDIIKSSQDFLMASRHSNGGWSYSPHVPPDADSTAWCLMALQSYPEMKGEAIKTSKSFLWGNADDRGISTYGKDSGIMEFISVTTTEMIRGWTSAHPSVSAAACLTDPKGDKVPEILSWLLDLRTEHGLIKSYWWRSPYYATALMLRVMSKKKISLPEEWAINISKSLIAEQLDNGGYGLDGPNKMDAFVTALAVEIGTYVYGVMEVKAMSKIGNTLLLAQIENGSWEGGQNLRIPAPFVLDPEEVEAYDNVEIGGNSLVEDKNGLFATAMACHALDRWKNIITK